VEFLLLVEVVVEVVLVDRWMPAAQRA